MQQTWRWFGPRDPISLTKIRQAGATGIVTALCEVPVGERWTAEAVAERRSLIDAAGLRWSVVESLPVHSSVRLREQGFERYVSTYLGSLEALAAADVRTVCYNFMPVIDWTRTQLDWVAPDGSISLRFGAVEWAVFDVFVLQRSGARSDYSESELSRAEALHWTMSEADRERLIRNIAAGLPGANEQGYSLGGLRSALERWQSIDQATLRENLVAFLEAVTPVAERLGIRLCIHPDDPPRPLLGLPRIASCSADFDELFRRVPSPANGLTLCVGSLGAGVTNDLSALARRFASRVHFAHLRSVHNEPDGSFVEADLLAGDVDLVDVISVLIAEERRRRSLGEQHSVIAMRPDHGRTLEGDIADLPGYPWLGRLKALAELRGIIHAVERLS
jgi:mannonate dehydratase